MFLSLLADALLARRARRRRAGGGRRRVRARRAHDRARLPRRAAPRARRAAAAGRQPDAAAEDSLRLALDVARQQQARSFELRAATSLARLLHGVRARARRARRRSTSVYRLVHRRARTPPTSWPRGHCCPRWDDDTHGLRAQASHRTARTSPRSSPAFSPSRRATRAQQKRPLGARHPHQGRLRARHVRDLRRGGRPSATRRWPRGSARGLFAKPGDVSGDGPLRQRRIDVPAGFQARRPRAVVLRRRAGRASSARTRRGSTTR